VAVGGRPEHRGVIAAASYEARRWGIHSAMSSRTALRLCSELILLPPRFDIYSQPDILLDNRRVRELGGVPP
jgi:DNA polymerase-4